ncbi:VOC family protein [Qipengyuania soli]|uniref:VOC family protein n=2 Tax=Qipengyuania TaxID=1855416 RepID=A0A7S8F434_9SPHN|nr:VOC family protein [Qipengyuania soli]QPC98786.1 VOC family protein [Qipengyuania soli]
MSLPPLSPPIAFVLTANRSLSKPFYSKILGLPLLGEDDFAVAFDLGHGAMLRLTDMASHIPSPHTVLGWRVEDIAATMADLTAKGVAFQVYDGMGQDENGVWSAGPVKVAWFLDPEGNNLSISQFD